MRAQLRGLNQAIRNSNDGISLIQTAEGALDETHAMLKRLKELAVQAGNGTYTDEERKYMQDEIENLKTEIDRISIATDFNGIKLLDGSLGGGKGSSSAGAEFGFLVNDLGEIWHGASIISNIVGVAVNFSTDNVTGAGHETAVWDLTDSTPVLTLNLAQNTTYSEAQINSLIQNAQRADDAGNAPPEVRITLAGGQITTRGSAAAVSLHSIDPAITVAGVQAMTAWTELDIFFTEATTGAAGHFKSAAFIQFMNKSYGEDQTVFQITTDDTKPTGTAFIDTHATDPLTNAGRIVQLNLATGVAYTAADLENILRQGGFDITVRLADSDGSGSGAGEIAPTGNERFIATEMLAFGTGLVLDMNLATNIQLGDGLGNRFVGLAGDGITFQIGANNAVEQRVTLNINDMGARALGIADLDVSTVANAQKAMDSVESAIVKVSEQRAALGAMQNRLEHTVNSLTVAAENLTAAESQIRDTDMAKEMVEYTKFNILQQAAQAMLAQANQAPQAILQLLR
jgi:flagellin